MRIDQHNGWFAGRPARSVLFPALLCAALLAASCGDASSADEPGAPSVEASVEVSPFASDRTCAGAFVPIDLDHVTSGPGDTSSTFDGTGAGTAVGDLDDDGDLDIVMANLSGQSTLLRNQGGLRFEAEPLMAGRFRHVAIVDVEGDDDLDIVLSTGLGTPVLLQNTGRGGPVVDAFDRTELVGVRAITYSMGWADLGGDGDLDLVTGSYNAELSRARNSPVLGSDTGVIVHEREGDEYVVTRVAAEAQALAVQFLDMNADGAIDILVGNDLATPDGVWLDNDGGWLRVEPFTTTTFSTMSLDVGDVDNDGDFDLYATDMAPMSDDPADLERYAEVAIDMAAMPVVDDVQIPENVLLQAAGGDPGDLIDFDNVAPAFGVRATGWSWAGLFGDLDSDGLLDLYVANGMRSDELFAALPNDRLVEPNQAFRNTGTSMEPAPDWQLADDAGGRGMALADLDDDGDLDIVVNNLDEPARLFENQICGGHDMIVELEWPGSANTDAVSAIVTVTSGDRSFTRQISATRGYLSGGPLSAHFGLGEGDTAVSLRVEWPDGAITDINDLAVDHRVTVTRSSAPIPPA